MKIRIIITSVALVIPLCAHAEIASGTPQTNNGCGENCSWSLSDDGVLTVYGTGLMGGYECIDTKHWLWEGGMSTWQTLAPWGEYSGQIKSIDIKEGIESIGYRAFYNVAATNVHIPNSVKQISYGAFQYSNLQEVIIPDSVEKISGAAFYETPISTIVIPENTLLDPSDFIFTRLSTLYCPYNMLQTCERSVTEATKIEGYEKVGNAYFVNGKFYSSLSDMQKGHYQKKRIYTIEEAEKVSKKTGNIFRLRYK